MDFSEVLSVKVADVEPVPLIPAGHYIWKPTRYSLDDFTSKKDGTEYKAVNIFCQAVNACSDVDPEMLKEFGGVKNARNKINFMWQSSGDDDEAKAAAIKAQNQLRRFLIDHCGIEDGGQSLGQMLDGAMNSANFLGDIKYRKDERDPEILYAEIGRTAPVTDAPE